MKTIEFFLRIRPALYFLLGALLGVRILALITMWVTGDFTSDLVLNNTYVGTLGVCLVMIASGFITWRFLCAKR